MTSPQQFLLPDVGEGLTEAEILAWSVRPGDTVEVNQIIVEVETAKAAVELPSPYAGVVSALHAEVGESLAVGKPLITIDTGPPGETADGPSDGRTTRQSEPEQAALLVGYGPQGAGGGRRRRRSAAPPDGTAQPAAGRSDHVAARPAAKPPVRKLAKDLGVDLTTVTPTGPGGTITREDVREAAARATAETPPLPAPDTARPAETRIPIRGVRKHTAAAMVASAFTAPHVTEFITVDVTATMRLRELVVGRREFRDLRVTPLLFFARALVIALAKTPEANSSWDEAAQEIVLKHYVNLGVAAATDRGLVVPNIKGADRMSLRELAQALADLTATARAGRTSPQDMTGGTVTLTNVGVFGVDTGTPLLNPGEAAILAVGAVRRMPWVIRDDDGDERIEPRWVTQLALSFDHRLMDGRQGSELLAGIAEILHEPGLALL
ncbi:dihydrolipoamide acetyltransferase family protein [Streptomyces sp. MBT62]|uniref:dihydrolipoamide acetyltransferase family protein n=1 Tax=Streptomyces sp. MBT62 TaxID=2800410 RepID=UPI0019094BAD|nr:dihydrolipoamide acetyltransferase family protein [Streptomyces sp. MBT62]MBK3562292.1 2-oxo acid dehydrogenase subunit E2 [Streptomyces sp. MBT62]